jgi:SAM-dependent methyltransferase
MYSTRSLYLKVNGFLKSYGPSKIKSILWDKEYSTDKWTFADDTAGDCLYSHLEKYAANGSILDLGCGSGNTANEVSSAAYRSYVGVDISETALRKATKRSRANGRGDKNRFVQGDFLSYVPTQRFDVILFRESMYHVPVGRVRAVLDRYARYLADSGVFIVRLNTTDGVVGTAKWRPTAMVGIIEQGFNVVEKGQYGGHSGPTVLVFCPQWQSAVGSISEMGRSPVRAGTLSREQE